MALPPCRRIVVGSDLSRGSDAAVRLAVAWAAQHDAEVLVVHAATKLASASRGELEEALRTQATESAADEMGVPVELRIVEDDPREALAAAATREGDWLCAGCEGASATVLRKAGRVAGGLADWVTGAGRPPLLLAPLGWSAPPRRRHRMPAGSGLPARKRTSATFGRVLVGVLDVERDRGLVESAIAHVAASNGTLALAHVIDVAQARFHPPSSRAALRERTDDATLRLRERLGDLATELVPLDLAARMDVQVHVIVQGTPERDLAGLARSQSAELLMVGGGGVATWLPAFTPCPMLVLP